MRCYARGLLSVAFSRISSYLVAHILRASTEPVDGFESRKSAEKTTDLQRCEQSRANLVTAMCTIVKEGRF